MSVTYSLDATKEWGEFYELIGRIVVTINTAHWCVFEMMGILLNMERDETSAIYYSLKADAAQRDLTLAIAADRLTDPTEAPLVSRIGAAINELGKCSGIRNGFIHTHWAIDFPSKKMTVMDGKPHPKLQMNNLPGQGQKLLEDLDKIIDRMLTLCDELEDAPSVRKLRERTGGHRSS